MSKRSNWCEFDKETRKYIKKRDKEECVICHNKGALQIMHIFMSRAMGGKGDKRNGCLGCVKCHRILDNAIGSVEKELSKKYMETCRNYLIEKEKITDINKLMEELKYKKEYTPFENKPTIKTCKNCKYLVKNTSYNSTIPSYYCKVKHSIMNKTSEACKDYK